MSDFLISVVTNPLFSVATFLFGLLLGNWLAIGRDRRREWNEAVAPIRRKLEKEVDEPNPLVGITDDEVFAILWNTRCRVAAARTRSAIADYRKAQDEQRGRDDTVGGLAYKDPKPVAAAAAKVAAMLRAK